MIIQFKAVAPVTLGDDLNTLGGGRWTVELENWGLTAKVQEDDLPQPAGGVPFIYPLGNLKGPLVFTATNSFGTFQAGCIDFGQKLALVNLQDALTLFPYGNTDGNAKFVYANSVLESVHRVPNKSNGVKWALRYQFRIGAQTITTI